MNTSKLFKRSENISFAITNLSVSTIVLTSLASVNGLKWFDAISSKISGQAAFKYTSYGISALIASFVVANFGFNVYRFYNSLNDKKA